MKHCYSIAARKQLTRCKHINETKKPSCFHTEGVCDSTKFCRFQLSGPLDFDGDVYDIRQQETVA